MGRRRKASRRTFATDAKFKSDLIWCLISHVMNSGKKSTAERVVYSAMDQVKTKIPDKETVEVFTRAIDNIKPRVEVKSRRVGGATYQVPVEVNPSRQMALAMRWLIQYSHARKGVPMARALAMEIADAYQEQGNAVKKRDDVHKMAQANKAFAHYRW